MCDDLEVGDLVRLVRAQEAMLNLFLRNSPQAKDDFRSAMRELGVTVREITVDHHRIDYEVLLPRPINYIRIDLKV